MQKTSNYQLSQYEASDRLTCEAVNADTRVVDAALARVAAVAAAAGNCFVEYGTYMGDDQNTRTFTFSRRPLFFYVRYATVDFAEAHLVALQGAATANICTIDGESPYYVRASWSGNSLTSTGTAKRIFNTSSQFVYIALLDNGASS